MTIPDTLKAGFPRTGENAPVNVHKVYSLGREKVINSVTTPGREPDRSPLQLDERWQRMRPIVDSGHASLQLSRQATQHDGTRTNRR